MALELQYLSLGRTDFNDRHNPISPASHFYGSQTDDESVVLNGYFTPVVQNLTYVQNQPIIVGDFFYIYYAQTGEASIYTVTVADPINGVTLTSNVNAAPSIQQYIFSYHNIAPSTNAPGFVGVQNTADLVLPNSGAVMSVGLRSGAPLTAGYVQANYRKNTIDIAQFVPLVQLIFPAAVQQVLQSVTPLQFLAGDTLNTYLQVNSATVPILLDISVVFNCLLTS
jgi:hypothetical protein